MLPVSSLAEAVEALNHPVAGSRRAAGLLAAAARSRPISPTSAASCSRGARSRSPAPAATTCSWSVRPGAGKTMMARRVPGNPAAADLRRGAGGDLGALGRRPAAGRRRAWSSSGRSARRTTRSRTRRSSAAARSRGRARSASRTTACSSSTRCSEFSRHVLEVLRQPLEEGRVAIARAARTAVFPARFVLVGAMNPCPCGFAGDAVRECRCTPQQVARYQGAAVGAAARPARSDGRRAGRAARRARRGAPRASRRPRCARGSSTRAPASSFATSGTGVRANASLSPALLARHCRLDHARACGCCAQPSRSWPSARAATTAIRKVARTIADLAGSGRRSQADHVAEALQFRTA